MPEGHILTNRISINGDGVVKGVVATFQEVTQFQNAERTIWQNFYGKGLVSNIRLTIFKTRGQIFRSVPLFLLL